MADFKCWDCGRETVYDDDYEEAGYWYCPHCDKYFYEGYDEDGDSVCGMSVYEAAQIWVSHGKDEDYMFGFSEDELEGAL